MKLWIDPLPFAVVLVSLVCALPGAGADRPNILFIYTDDQSHVTVSCYPEAYDWVRTPNIDALAADGIRFRFAYIGSWCMPSRATLLTGHHSYGVESMRMAGSYPGSEYNPEKCPFWPKVFRENGYQTAQIGKWHTGTDTGFGRDWDYQAVWNRPRHTGNAGSYYQEQLIEFNGGEAELVQATAPTITPSGRWNTFAEPRGGIGKNPGISGCATARCMARSPRRNATGRLIQMWKSRSRRISTPPGMGNLLT